MGDHESEKAWIDRFEKMMANSTAEELAAGLGTLVLMKAEFKNENLYRQIFRNMATKITLKTIDW